jgi:hypothetical protein
MAKINLAPLYDSTSKLLDSAQDVRTKQGLAQREADRLAKALPAANVASVSASAAKSIYQRIEQGQDKLGAAGVDPAEFYAGFLDDAARLLQSGQDTLLDAKRALDLP